MPSPFSNSTDFEIWAGNGRACYDCAKDGIGTTGDEPFCPILGLAITGEWPDEWQHDTGTDQYGAYDRVGECTEFERRRDDGPGEDQPEPPPPPEVDGQTDIFEVFADQIVEQATELAAEVAR